MSSVFAAATTNSGSSSLLIFALPVLLIGWMFITQRRRQKAAQSLQSSLAVGDEITTTSGLFGTITALEDKVATVEVSPGVNLRFDRRAIAGPAAASTISHVSIEHLGHRHLVGPDQPHRLGHPRGTQSAQSWAQAHAGCAHRDHFRLLRSLGRRQHMGRRTAHPEARTRP